MDNQTNPETPESKVPEPPAMEIDIRTMESDIKAFKEGGGEVPNQGAQEAFASQRQEEMQKPAYSGPEKPLFETPMSPTTPIRPVERKEATGAMKTALLIGVVIIGIVGLGLLGYFVVFPYVFKLIG